MRRREQLLGSLLVLVGLASAASPPALACDLNANCRRQECSGGGKCVEVVDQVCEAHKAACIAFPPPSRNSRGAVGNSRPPSSSASRQITQERPSTTSKPSLIFESFDPQQKERFVNLVANEWLVKTASMSSVESPERVVQDTLRGAAGQMPNMTDAQKKNLIREILASKQEFSELHAATNAALTSLTEGVDRLSSANIGSGGENTIAFPCLRGKCD